MRMPVLVVGVSIVIALSVSSSRALADTVAGSFGGFVVNTDASKFFFTRANGTNCVYVSARGTAATALVNPPFPGAGTCTITAGLLAINGLGVTATKPTAAPPPGFGNAATNGGAIAAGSATFTYVRATFPSLDTATYSAQAQVRAPAPSSNFFPTSGPDAAWAAATDPLDFSTSTSGQFLAFAASLSSLGLTSENGTSGFFANYMLDGQNIFSLSIIAPPNPTTVSDLAVSYQSMLGSSFDQSELSTIMGALVVTPSSGSVSLSVPSLNLFPLTDLPLSQGSHELVGGDESVAAAAIPEPVSIVLLLTGLAALFLAPWKRART